MTTKLYSIIIATKDRERLCNQALKSVEESINHAKIPHQQVEVIIVDNSNSRMIYKTEQLKTKYLKNKEDMGLAYSRNRGGKLSKGKYIIFVDDDLILPITYFSIMKEITDNNTFDILGSRLYPEKNDSVNIAFSSIFALSKRVGFLVGYNLIITNTFFKQNKYTITDKTKTCEDYEYFIDIQSKKPRVLFSRRLYVTHAALTLTQFLKRMPVYGKGLDLIYRTKKIKKPIQLNNPIIDLKDEISMKEYFQKASIVTKLGSGILGSIFLLSIIIKNPRLFLGIKDYISRLIIKKSVIIATIY